MVENRINELLNEKRVYRWNEKKSGTSTTYSIEYVEFTGSMKVNDVRFSDDRKRLLISVNYQEKGEATDLQTILERDDFGIYAGVLQLPDDMNLALEVREPSEL